jgi:hypothetical protein
MYPGRDASALAALPGSYIHQGKPPCTRKS